MMSVSRSMLLAAILLGVFYSRDGLSHLLMIPLAKQRQLVRARHRQARLAQPQSQQQQKIPVKRSIQGRMLMPGDHQKSSRMPTSEAAIAIAFPI